MTLLPAAALSTFTSVQPSRKRPPGSGTSVGQEDRIRAALVAAKWILENAPLASNTLTCDPAVSATAIEFGHPDAFVLSVVTVAIVATLVATLLLVTLDTLHWDEDV